MIVFQTTNKIASLAFYLWLQKFDYKKNLIHPKTLVYVIAYKSSQTNKFKNTIIVGVDANFQNISGFDVNESKFQKYFENNKEKINEKFGYIFPTCWFATRIFLKDSPIIFLGSFLKWFMNLTCGFLDTQEINKSKT